MVFRIVAELAVFIDWHRVELTSSMIVRLSVKITRICSGYEIGSFIEKGDKFFWKILVSKVVDFIGGV